MTPSRRATSPRPSRTCTRFVAETATKWVQILRAGLRRVEVATRPDDPEVAAAHAARWQELPAAVRTPAQMIGRKFTGCEGTHGVFPACDFGCEPCYHGAEANRVRVDGRHTVAEVERQMAYLRRRRGPGQYAQLIGGEVSLLPPEDHAAALAAMRRHGRIPMSFTHGDFDDDYLEALALHPDGTPRFRELAFAVHVDATMRGRRAVRRPAHESQLHAERARIAAMFDRLRERHGVRTYLAHSMTVTPANVDGIPEVVRVCRDLGYRMCSFQPAAYVGDTRRWDDGYRELDDDLVWSQVERGVGRRLPFRALQAGDERCNRSTWGVWAGDRYLPVFDDGDPRDLSARDAWFAAVPANLRPDPWPRKLARTARSFAAAPRAAATLAGWSARYGARAAAGLATTATDRSASPGPRLLPTTYVMHRFMDADDVRRAWDLMERGVAADDPRLREAQERLRACAYGMAHPEEDRVVPACVQHSVLDPGENQQLLQLLPRRRRDRRATA
jgi:hypothetical protein